MTKGDLRRIMNDEMRHISDDAVVYFNDTKTDTCQFCKTDTLFEVNVLVVADDGEKIILEVEDVY